MIKFLMYFKQIVENISYKYILKVSAFVFLGSLWFIVTKPDYYGHNLCVQYTKKDFTLFNGTFEPIYIWMPWNLSTCFQYKIELKDMKSAAKAYGLNEWDLACNYEQDGAYFFLDDVRMTICCQEVEENKLIYYYYDSTNCKLTIYIYFT